MKNFFNEAEDITMDVQAGPAKEVETSVDKDHEGDCDYCCSNPVDDAKKDPNTIPVAKKTVTDGCCEFFIDASDVAKYADLNEETFLEALNDIIACNEGSGIEAGNIVVVMNESTSGYARNLERNGGAYIFVNEADDISMDVQTGPNGEEINVSEDPQEANPVDAVKRQYDSIVIAGKDDKFFVDVEDVQKCADVNCESVIETLNGIIACNEDYDINTENLFVVIGENCGYADIESLEESGANIVVIGESSNIKSIKAANSIIRKTTKVVKQFFADNSVPASVNGIAIGGENSKFVSGKGNKILIGIGSSYSSAYGDTAVKSAMSIVKKKNAELLKMLNDEIDEFEYTSARVAYGRIGTINIEFTVKPKSKKKDDEE